ncbi:MAG: hypothetical protein II871_02525 [Clostridia bacterium]|nr:hypothetical protein [Clostridia bacterium]
MELCRYVSFQRFCEMVMSSKLTLISPEKWNDKYENYLLRALEKPLLKQAFSDMLSDKLNLDKTQIDDLLCFSNTICAGARCLCFSKSIDEEVMWNAYNYGSQTVMWKTTDSKIEKINNMFDIRKVKYDLEELGVKGFVDLFSRTGATTGVTNPHNLFTHKRKMFSYENEFRVIDYLDEPNSPTFVAYPIEDISHFIDCVMVHPLAEDWYVSVIELICKNYNIKFCGRSQIYQLNNLY